MSGASKFDAEKVRMDLLSEPAIEGLARVLTFGAKKYADDNWRLGMNWRRCIGAALRHVFEFMRGNDLDPESGLPHVDHAMCCLMFLSEYQKRELGKDDRWRGRPVQATVDEMKPDRRAVCYAFRPSPDTVECLGCGRSRNDHHQ